MATKTEYLKTLITAVGGDASALPDNLESTHYKALLEAIANGGGGASSGGTKTFDASKALYRMGQERYFVDEELYNEILEKGFVNCNFIFTEENRVYPYTVEMININFIPGGHMFICDSDTNEDYMRVYFLIFRTQEIAFDYYNR